MPLKFCLGAPNISAGYAVANVHLMISSFMIISLAGVVDTLADPIFITILVLVLLFAIGQAHDMFSRIFQISTNLRIFSTKCYVIFWVFLKFSKLSKNTFFDQ